MSDGIILMNGGRKKPRQGSITLEEAKKRFNEYYMQNTTDKVGRMRAKMFDMMYQKAPKYTLKSGEPGSEKYLLEKGPKTFDMVGVDWFPEGEKFVIEDPEYEPFEEVSKGATKQSKDEDPEKIYGPRLRDNNKLFSEFYSELYKEDPSKGEAHWKNYAKDKLKLEKPRNLVQIYWEKYKKGLVKKRANKKGWKEELNKKNKFKAIEEEIGFINYKGTNYSLSENGVVMNRDTGEYVGNIVNDYEKMSKDLIEKLKELAIEINEDEVEEKPTIYINSKNNEAIVVLSGNVYRIDESGIPSDFLGTLPEYLDYHKIYIEDLTIYEKEELDKLEEPKKLTPKKKPSKTDKSIYRNPKSEKYFSVIDNKVFEINEDGDISKKSKGSLKNYMKKSNTQKFGMVPLSPSDREIRKSIRKGSKKMRKSLKKLSGILSNKDISEIVKRLD